MKNSVVRELVKMQFGLKKDTEVHVEYVGYIAGLHEFEVRWCEYGKSYGIKVVGKMSDMVGEFTYDNLPSRRLK